MKKREGYNYRTCVWCGKEWNVSVQNKDKQYSCPVCRKRGKDGRKRQADDP